MSKFKLGRKKKNMKELKVLYFSHDLNGVRRTSESNWTKIYKCAQSSLSNFPILEISKLTKRVRTITMVGMIEGEVVGVIIFQLKKLVIKKDNILRYIEITLMATKYEFIGKGIGSNLMTKLKNKFPLLFVVSPDNLAQRFYEKNGFVGVSSLKEKVNPFYLCWVFKSRNYEHIMDRIIKKKYVTYHPFRNMFITFKEFTDTMIYHKCFDEDMKENYANYIFDTLFVRRPKEDKFCGKHYTKALGVSPEKRLKYVNFVVENFPKIVLSKSEKERYRDEKDEVKRLKRFYSEEYFDSDMFWVFITLNAMHIEHKSKGKKSTPTIYHGCTELLNKVMKDELEDIKYECERAKKDFPSVEKMVKCICKMFTKKASN